MDKVIPTRTNDAKVVVKFLSEDIFAILGIPQAIISVQGTHIWATLVAR